MEGCIYSWSIRYFHISIEVSWKQIFGIKSKWVINSSYEFLHILCIISMWINEKRIYGQARFQDFAVENKHRTKEITLLNYNPTQTGEVTASTPIASASNRTWTLTEPGLYLICELADKHDYQNQQLTIYKGTLLVKMISLYLSARYCYSVLTKNTT